MMKKKISKAAVVRSLAKSKSLAASKRTRSSQRRPNLLAELAQKIQQKLTPAPKEEKRPTDKNSLYTSIPGFDALIEGGIPLNISLIVAGGAGSGKTIFCLQMLANVAKQGKKSLYLSFEEPEERLQGHLQNFGFNGRELEKKGLLKIIRKDSFRLSTSLEAMMAKAQGELLLDLNEVLEIIPEKFMPEVIVVDSITAIAAAFAGKEEGYRIFIEQLFRYFESLPATVFFISEADPSTNKFSPTGVEEFLADGVIVLYNLRQGNIRTTALEVLKMRGRLIQKKLVPFQILPGKGIEVYAEEQMFTENS